MTRLRLLLLLIAVGAILASLWCLDEAAKADEGSPPPPTPPTPVPVLATGGGGGGSSPGTSCVPRLLLRSVPGQPSATYTWNQNGDSGWPFGWPGLPWVATPTTAPTVGCSR